MSRGPHKIGKEEVGEGGRGIVRIRAEAIRASRDIVPELHHPSMIDLRLSVQRAPSSLDPRIYPRLFVYMRAHLVCSLARAFTARARVSYVPLYIMCVAKMYIYVYSAMVSAEREREGEREREREREGERESGYRAK